MHLGCLNCRICLGQDIPEQLIPLLGFLQDKILVSKPPTLLSSPTIPYALQEIQERFCRAEESAKCEMGFWPFCWTGWLIEPRGCRHLQSGTVNRIAWSLRTLSARNKVQLTEVRNQHNAGHASWLVESSAEVHSSDGQEAT